MYNYGKHNDHTGKNKWANDNLGIAIKNASLVVCLEMVTPPSFVFRCGSIF